MSEQRNEKTVGVQVAFAADARGAGVAYAAIDDAGRQTVVRVAFRAKDASAAAGREIAYAALGAVAERLRPRLAEANVRFYTADEALSADLSERRPLPAALTMPYVALRCRLNRFRSATVRLARSAEIGDLTARAIAEVSLHVAA